MLRPISQLKPRPKATIKNPSATMVVRVRACEAASSAAAASMVLRACAMIWSVRGSMS
jgi:hypothetical protein